ncbi:host attachment family protein [Jannaschia seohaensis]|uniref:Protein required for attachment to host cells n=1 Tax=Jannaschia seohaensis TaxID=475081 RepID=A0A2Y9C8L9_9RHOB|nr:host attachment family protein [Jannaschia seohaensis]PWJ15849.1 protein required for attachment to host cells [Jannaschia seohaensis]SSA49553.1 Protein required for attachment to host cells [Jannaschia seohaensis]
MTGIPHDALVVVTDSEKVLFLRNRTDAQDPNLAVTGKEEEPNPPDRAQTENLRGRQSESTGSGVYAYDETDFHELQKERFAADLAEKLYALAHVGAFERLILVAPPTILGVIRDEMHKEVEDKLIATIDKTLTNHPRDKIEKIVAETLKTA